MLRFIIRLIGYGLIAIGFANLVVDGTASLSIGTLYLTDLSQIAKAVAPQGLVDLQNYVRLTFIEHSISFILLIPSTIFFVFTGLMLVVLARRPKAEIGFQPME
jgi:hypothetical protein